MTDTLSSDDALAVHVPVATLWTDPDAPRQIDAAAVEDSPDVAAWTAAMDVTVRKGLHGRTLTQLLLGEPVEVLEERGDWCRVQAPHQPSSLGDGYPGWIRRAHLGQAVPATETAQATAMMVQTSHARCTVAGGEVSLSFGTELPVVDVSGGVATALLPGGRHGCVAATDLAASGHATATTALDFARTFVGLRYLWGGTSAWGLDCSGLVHLSLRAAGVRIPRDAFDQAADVQPVPLDAVREGDLYFFARAGQRIYHVGFVAGPPDGQGEPWMLHAPEGGELIEEAPLAPHRRAHLVLAGRVQLPDEVSPSGGRGQPTEATAGRG